MTGGPSHQTIFDDFDGFHWSHIAVQNYTAFDTLVFFFILCTQQLRLNITIRSSNVQGCAFFTVSDDLANMAQEGTMKLEAVRDLLHEREVSCWISGWQGNVLWAWRVGFIMEFSDVGFNVVLVKVVMIYQCYQCEI